MSLSSKGSYILVSGKKIPPMRDDLTRESEDFDLSFCKNLSSRIHSGRSLQDDKSKQLENFTLSSRICSILQSLQITINGRPDRIIISIHLPVKILTFLPAGIYFERNIYGTPSCDGS